VVKSGWRARCSSTRPWRPDKRAFRVAAVPCPDESRVRGRTWDRRRRGLTAISPAVPRATFRGYLGTTPRLNHLHFPSHGWERSALNLRFPPHPGWLENVDAFRRGLDPIGGRPIRPDPWRGQLPRRRPFSPRFCTVKTLSFCARRVTRALQRFCRRALGRGWPGASLMTKRRLPSDLLWQVGPCPGMSRGPPENRRSACEPLFTDAGPSHPPGKKHCAYGRQDAGYTPLGTVPRSSSSNFR